MPTTLTRCLLALTFSPGQDWVFRGVCLAGSGVLFGVGLLEQKPGAFAIAAVALAILAVYEVFAWKARQVRRRLAEHGVAAVGTITARGIIPRGSLYWLRVAYAFDGRPLESDGFVTCRTWYRHHIGDTLPIRVMTNDAAIWLATADVR